MISAAQLQSLEFEYNEENLSWTYKEITIFFNEDNNSMSIDLSDFELYGIRDVRDLTKLIELVYGK